MEGPFDAIAVTIADPGRHAGLAPCGTALTSKQAALLAQAADLGSTGVLVAFDDDPAGRKAAVRAYGILRTVSGRLQSAVLSGKDPAEILQTEGPAALRTVLRDQVQPLSAVVIDAHLAPWERRLQDPEGPLLAMRSTAALIAGLLPPGAPRRSGRSPATGNWPRSTSRCGPSRTPNSPRSPASCLPTPPTRPCGSPNGSASPTTPMSWPRSPTRSPAAPSGRATARRRARRERLPAPARDHPPRR